MKKTLLFLAPLLVLPLASCNNAGKTLNEQKGSSVFTKEFIQRNFSYEANNPFKFEGFERIGEAELRDNTVVSSSPHGFYAILKNANAEDSLFSIFDNKVITKMADENLETVYDASHDYVGEFALVKTADNKNALYSHSGELLYSTDHDLRFGSPKIGFDDLDFYYTIHLVETTDIGDRELSVYYAMEDVSHKDYSLNEMIPPTLLGTRLDSLGLKGHKLIENGLHWRVEKGGKKVSEFDVPRGEPDLVLGQYLFFYDENQLPDSMVEFDFIRNGKKYVDNITRFDMLTGKKTNIKLNGFTFASPNIKKVYKDKDGAIKYGVMEVVPLSSDKVVLSDNVRTYILDSDLNLHEDMTDIRIPCGLEFNNKMYVVDMYDCEIYDNNLKLLGDFYDMADEFIPVANVFIGKQNGKYGLFNVEGKVVVPFIYDNIYSVYSNGSAYGELEGKYKKISYNAMSGDADSNVDAEEPDKTESICTNLSFDYYKDSKKLVVYHVITGEVVKEFTNVEDYDIAIPMFDIKVSQYKGVLALQMTDEGNMEVYAATHSIDLGLYYMLRD